MTDDESYVAFVTARWAALFRTSYLLSGSTGAAEDLLQTTLLKAYAAWARIEGMAAPEAYVRAMLVNTFLSGRRRKSATRELSAADVPERSVASHEDRVVERSSLWDRVKLLPPRQRAVVVLRYYEDLPERQIAELLGCSAGTVKSQASDALRTLKRALEAAEPSPNAGPSAGGES